MSDKTFEVVATYTVTPGSENEVLANLRNLAAASRTEEGNLRYEFFQGVEDPNKIVILESYRTADDFQHHRETPHFKEIAIKAIIPLLQSRSVSTYDSRNS